MDAPVHCLRRRWVIQGMIRERISMGTLSIVLFLEDGPLVSRYNRLKRLTWGRKVLVGGVSPDLFRFPIYNTQGMSRLRSSSIFAVCRRLRQR